MRNGEDLHGWIILDKPEGITSAQAVGRVKRLLKPGKIGHGGTLDPLASGVLPLALGEATKTFGYAADARKSYSFTVRWGEQRATDDAEGEIVAASDARPAREEIEAALPRFTGLITQVPPAYSAIKINGERAYARARKGEEVDMPSREAVIHALLLLEMPDRDHAAFEVSCGKGTYVRSLARDIALAVGTTGHVSALKRLKVGNFDISRAISLDKLEEVVYNHAPAVWLLPVESALDDIPAITLDSAQAAGIRHGRAVRVPPRKEAAGQTVVCMQQGRVVALGELTGGLLRPVRVFNY